MLQCTIEHVHTSTYTWRTLHCDWLLCTMHIVS